MRSILIAMQKCNFINAMRHFLIKEEVKDMFTILERKRSLFTLFSKEENPMAILIVFHKHIIIKNKYNK